MSTQKREARISDVLIDYLTTTRPEAPCLIMNSASARLANALEGTASWNRRAGGAALPTPWPEGGPYASVILRLPKSKSELQLALAMAHAVLAEQGKLFLYGSNDEGIKSAPNHLAPYFDRPVTELTKGKGRIIRAAPTAEKKTTLADWREEVVMETPAGTFTLVSYPGLFAHGRLDAGTETLLTHMPKTEGPVNVLDYGCGTGVIARALLAQNPEARLTLFDNDVLALEAAKENVPQADALLGSKLFDLGAAKFDLILSNPPFHVGKDQDFSALEDLCSQAPKHLARGGKLRMVVQRTAPVAKWLEASFSSSSVVAENKSFRIWEAR
ncbi:MAG: class I SAM-dependent methyltransferase [Alphaproteobacteria bacterium]|nr:MAG: class I SAM-dependent methyltransferase [Alphaproteobacteria bacterium]